MQKKRKRIKKKSPCSHLCEQGDCFTLCLCFVPYVFLIVCDSFLPDVPQKYRQSCCEIISAIIWMPEIAEKSLEYRERMFCSESAIFWIPGHRGGARCWPKTWKRGLDQDRGDLRQRFDTVRREKSIFSGGSKLAHFASL